DERPWSYRCREGMSRVLHARLPFEHGGAQEVVVVHSGKREGRLEDALLDEALRCQALDVVVVGNALRPLVVGAEHEPAGTRRALDVAEARAAVDREVARLP